MNFQAVRQVKGQKDAKNYPEKVDMIGVFVEIGGGAYTPNQKLFCDCQIRDMVQEKHKVRLYVKEAIPLALLNTECSFSISAYDGTFTDPQTKQQKTYEGYSGFWNDQVLQRPAQGQVTPYQPPQTPPQQPQQTNSAQGAVTDAQLLAFAERVLKVMESLAYPNANTTRPTQPSGPNPDYVGDDPAPPEDSDIPF